MVPRVPLAEDRGLVKNSPAANFDANNQESGRGRRGQLFPERTGTVSVDPGYRSRPYA